MSATNAEMFIFKRCYTGISPTDNDRHSEIILLARVFRRNSMSPFMKTTRHERGMAVMVKAEAGYLRTIDK